MCRIVICYCWDACRLLAQVSNLFCVDCCWLFLCLGMYCVLAALHQSYAAASTLGRLSGPAATRHPPLVASKLHWPRCSTWPLHHTMLKTPWLVHMHASSFGQSLRILCCANTMMPVSAVDRHRWLDPASAAAGQHVDLLPQPAAVYTVAG